MLYIALSLMVFCSFLSSLSQFFFKWGARDDPSAGLTRLFQNKKVLLGVVLYPPYFFLITLAYKFGDMTLLYPIVELSLIWNIFLSKKYLDEHMSPSKYWGTFLILIGCFALFF